MLRKRGMNTSQFAINEARFLLRVSLFQSIKERGKRSLMHSCMKRKYAMIRNPYPKQKW